MIDKYETPYGNLIVNVDAHRIISAVSSGFDSALLLYMTALAARKYNPTLKIYPVTARRTNNYTRSDLRSIFDRVDNYANAVKVVEWVKSVFPDIDIKENLLYDCHFWNYCTDDPIMGSNHTYVSSIKTLTSYVLSLPATENSNVTYNSIMMNGVTKHPDFELAGYNPEPHRNKKMPVVDKSLLSIERTNVIKDTSKNNESDIKVLFSEVFRNGDKRVTFWLADQLGILDTLLKITRSCEGVRELSKNWTEECHHCWWCYERTWAHETYKDQQPYDQDKYKSPDYFNALKDQL